MVWDDGMLARWGGWGEWRRHCDTVLGCCWPLTRAQEALCFRTLAAWGELKLQKAKPWIRGPPHHEGETLLSILSWRPTCSSAALPTGPPGTAADFCYFLGFRTFSFGLVAPRKCIQVFFPRNPGFSKSFKETIITSLSVALKLYLTVDDTGTPHSVCFPRAAEESGSVYQGEDGWALLLYICARLEFQHLPGPAHLHSSTYR